MERLDALFRFGLDALLSVSLFGVLAAAAYAISVICHVCQTAGLDGLVVSGFVLLERAFAALGGLGALVAATVSTLKFILELWDTRR